MLSGKNGKYFQRERDDDVGENKTYPVKINLKDSNPVQLNYNSVPRNLCNEIKMYIEHLLKKNWIVHSSSTYSSPVVVVREKDGSIRMCCNYRQLHGKTILDRHPLHHIQNILDNLGKKSVFYTFRPKKGISPTTPTPK